MPGSNHPVTFSSQRSVTIPAGAKARSDPLPLQVEAEQDHAVSLFVPGPTGQPSWTDFLARRPQACRSPCFGAGALARLDRDVLAQTGIRQVILSRTPTTSATAT